MANLDPLLENTRSGVLLHAPSSVSLQPQVNYAASYPQIPNLQQQQMSYLIPVAPPSYPTWPQDTHVPLYEPSLSLEEQQMNSASLVTPSFDETQFQDGFIPPLVQNPWLQQPEISYTPPPVLGSILEQQIDYAFPDEQFGYVVPEQQLDYPIPEQELDYAFPEQQLDYAIPEQQLDYIVPEMYLNYTVPEQQLGYAVPEQQFGNTVPEQPLDYAAPDGPSLGLEQTQVNKQNPIVPVLSGQQKARSIEKPSGQPSESPSPKKRRRRFAKTLSKEDLKNPSREQVNEFNSKKVQMSTFLEGVRSIHKKPRAATAIQKKKQSQPRTMQPKNHLRQEKNTMVASESASRTPYIPDVALLGQQTGLLQFRPSQAKYDNFNDQSQGFMPNTLAQVQVMSYNEQNALGRMM